MSFVPWASASSCARRERSRRSLRMGDCFMAGVSVRRPAYEPRKNLSAAAHGSERLRPERAAPPSSSADGHARCPSLSRWRHSTSPTASSSPSAVKALAKQCAIMKAAHAYVGVPEWRTRPGGYAGLARIIAYQQLSTKAAGTIWGRVEVLLGKVTPAVGSGGRHRRAARLRDVAAEDFAHPLDRRRRSRTAR